MDLHLLRVRLRRWLGQPMGAFALMLLLLGVAVAGGPRLQVHAHVRADAAHVQHDHEHARVHGHEAAAGAGSTHHAPDEAVLHVHTTVVAAAVLPMTGFAPATLMPMAAGIAQPARIRLPSRPQDLFRPPIA